MIQIRTLIKVYGDKLVLSNISFDAPDGHITGFVGPNGAGKSTTMRMVACLENPDRGTALVDRMPYSEAENPGRVMGVYLGQGYLPTHMTGAEYLTYVCRLAGMETGRVNELLQMVELTDAANKKIKSYSLGMKQRAGIAAALAGDPTTLMLDEPVNGLDPMGVQWLRGVLREQAKAGKAVLLSSHLLSELELVADRVVMLDHGRVVSEGAMVALERGNERCVVIRTSDDGTFAQLLREKEIEFKVLDEGEGLSISDLPAREVGRLAFEGGLLVDHLEEKRSSLEEVFMATATAGEEKEASHV